jgi:hypothetical protein
MKTGPLAGLVSEQDFRDTADGMTDKQLRMFVYWCGLKGPGGLQALLDHDTEEEITEEILAEQTDQWPAGYNTLVDIAGQRDIELVPLETPIDPEFTIHRGETQCGE